MFGLKRVWCNFSCCNSTWFQSKVFPLSIKIMKKVWGGLVIYINVKISWAAYPAAQRLMTLAPPFCKFFCNSPKNIQINCVKFMKLNINVYCYNLEDIKKHITNVWKIWPYITPTAMSARCRKYVSFLRKRFKRMHHPLKVLIFSHYF